MAIEIERKFLLRDDGWRTKVELSQSMAQGYLGGERVSVRVRIAGEQAWLNIKSRTRGAARAEFEYPIPLLDAQQLLDELCMPGRVVKVRHHVRHGRHLWEIDEFGAENAGLIVAEIELAGIDEAFERPPWLGREVTEELRYYNANLMQHPYAQWTDEERLAPC